MATKYVAWEHFPAGTSGDEQPAICDTLDEAKRVIGWIAESWRSEFPDWRVEVSDNGQLADAYDDTMDYSHRMTAYIEVYDESEIPDLMAGIEVG